MTPTRCPKLKESEFTLHPDCWDVNHGRFLLNFAVSKVSDFEKAQDLVQETFLSAWKGRKNFRGECKERTWLIAILRHRIIDSYRKTSRDPLILESETREDTGWLASFSSLSTRDAPDTRCNYRELMNLVDQAVATLPDQMQTVFRMRELEGKTTIDITRAEGISQSYVWVLIHRAKIQLRDLLKEVQPNPFEDFRSAA